MGTQKLSSMDMIKTHFDFVNKGFLEEFVHGTIFRISNFFWVLACKWLFHLFGVVLGLIFRLKADENSLKNDCNSGIDRSQDEDQIAKKENHDFVFRFEFQNSENSNTRSGETEESVFPETSPNPITVSKYQVVAGKDFSGFIKEPESMSFTTQELFVNSNDVPIVQEFLVDSEDDSSMENDQIISQVSDNEDFEEFNPETEEVNLEEREDSVQSSCSENVLENPEQVISTEHEAGWDQEMEGMENNQMGKNNFCDKFGFLAENQFLSLASEPESFSSSEGLSISNASLDSAGIENFPDRKLESSERIPNSQEINIHGTSCFDWEGIISRDEDEDIDDDFTEFEPILQFSSQSERKHYPSKLGKIETVNPVDRFGKFEEPSSKKKPWGSNCEEEEEEDGCDVLLKHQELIEQMKIEIKNAKARGLPTILEESDESPKMVEDLKPLEIDEKLGHKERTEEIQKVYKRYAEEMRKLDVLNYQTMLAISFLQLKDPTHQNPSQKSSLSSLKSLLNPNLWPCKFRRIYSDPSLKSITEFHRDLEMVYVGHICLSWEILHWQYAKARELLQHDSEILHHSFNQVAGEFQQFQVLVERFVENDKFQGPRVQNYAKNRFELPTLLQVPIIKDDCLRDKKDSRVEEENLVSIAMLAETIDESMRVFWELLRADKDEANLVSKGCWGTHVDHRDSLDSELMTNIKRSLQKKERRLNDMIRSGNCIVKKFQKRQEGRLDPTLLFVRVELKLVSRVLVLSRLRRDQLVWCQKKLNKIKFSNRKIHVEPSFLLFPL